MANRHHCVNAFCALCGIPSCLEPSTYPLRVQNDLAWTHRTVYGASVSLGFALHEACWEVFVQQYNRLAGSSRVPAWQLVLMIHSNLRPAGQGVSGQLPFFPTWCDRYTDSITRGRGPSNAWFPDGWAEDLWESVGLGRTTNEQREMDFLLVSPLAAATAVNKALARRNFERVHFCCQRLARALVVQQSDETMVLRRKVATGTAARGGPVAMTASKL